MSSCSEDDEEPKPKNARSVQEITYKSRMSYLKDTGNSTTPDAQFMSRNTSLRFAEHSSSPTVSNNPKPQSTRGRINRNAGLTGLARNSEWVEKVQAGCRFWQNVVSGECVTENPNISPVKEVSISKIKEASVEDDTMPDTFGFLTEKPNVQRSKIELLSGSTFPEKYVFMQKTPRKPD